MKQSRINFLLSKYNSNCNIGVRSEAEQEYALLKLKKEAVEILKRDTNKEDLREITEILDSLTEEERDLKNWETNPLKQCVLELKPTLVRKLAEYFPIGYIDSKGKTALMLLKERKSFTLLEDADGKLVNGKDHPLFLEMIDILTKDEQHEYIGGSEPAQSAE